VQKSAETNPLAGHRPGSEWLLKSIEGPSTLVERLYEIGFLPGETLRLHGKIPFGGPWLVEVRGMTVALRENEVRCLRI
jgi:Fe2+ transport system protein FeoA